MKMEVIFALFYKAAVVFTFIFGIRETQHWYGIKEWNSVFMFYILFVISLTLKRRHNSGVLCNILKYFVFELFQAVFIFHVMGLIFEEFDPTSVSDLTIPFFDYRSVFQCGCHEFLVIYICVYRYANSLRLQLWNYIFFIVYAASCTLICVCILNFLFSMVMASPVSIMKENCIETLDTNKFILSETRSSIHTLYVDSKRYAHSTSSTHQVIYPQDFRGKRPYIYQDFELWMNKDLPYSHQLFNRFIGEDILFKCECTINQVGLTTQWFHNKHALSKASRYIEINKIKLVDNETAYNVVSTLQINMLRRSDFGEYECKLSTSPELERINSMIFITRHIFVLGAFTLGQISPKPKLLFKQVGNIITSTRLFDYISFSDLDDISLSHTVNDKPIDYVCSGYINGGCSLAATLLRYIDPSYDMYIKKELPYVSLGEASIYTLDGTSLRAQKAYLFFCLCSEGIGVHKITFFRKMFYKSQNVSKLFEIPHPFVLFVLPHTQLSLFRYHDDSHLYKEIEQLINNGTALDIIENRVKSILKYLIANEQKVFTLADIVQTLLTFTFLTLAYISIRLATVIYFKYVFIKSYEAFLELSRLHKELRSAAANENFNFDIYMSNAEEEKDFVVQTLLPFFEKNCAMKVCFPDRDFEVNKMLIELYSTSITQSRNIIIILSEAYTSNVHCSTLQMEHLILPMLYDEERIDKHNVLIIEYDKKCKLPQPLRWNFEIGILKWDEHLSNQVQLMKIKRWLLTGEL